MNKTLRYNRKRIKKSQKEVLLLPVDKALFTSFTSIHFQYMREKDRLTTDSKERSDPL